MPISSPNVAGHGAILTERGKPISSPNVAGHGAILTERVCLPVLQMMLDKGQF